MTVYHPDPVINAQVIADSLDADIADLAAGYPPRRWRCICGVEHSRGHFQVVGIHRCLVCGYTGPEGVMFDDDGRDTASCENRQGSGPADAATPGS